MAATPATSLSLVSSGLADGRLKAPKGNPDIRQFVKVLNKTTRWAAQWNRIDFDGSPEFGQRVSMTLPIKGELITGFNIVLTMPDIYTIQQAAKAAAPDTFLGPTYGWTNSLGHALIQQIELEIGGAIVETMDSRMLEIYDELYETVESSVAKNAMIARTAKGFNQSTYCVKEPLTVTVPIPFWFSRPGIYSQALPIQALKSDIVRVHVTLRPLNQLFYTDARVDTRTVGYRAGTDTSVMWNLLGGRFWRANPAVQTRVYSMNSAMDTLGISGELIPDITMPLRMSPIDAYALVEYISLEEYEAIGFRTAELTYHVEQHMAVPSVNTNQNAIIRVPLPYGNPVKELMWVAQRPEAETYNAWFLFTRDLSALEPLRNGIRPPSVTPWWPDATPIPLEENKWQIIPAFREAYSEPIESATLLYNGIERFVHEGASVFRGVIPALQYVKAPVYNRYIYVYNFGNVEEVRRSVPQGMANWDKIQRKDMYITMNRGRSRTPPPNMNVYAYVTIWNVFKVFGGRGGMLFTN